MYDIGNFDNFTKKVFYLQIIKKTCHNGRPDGQSKGVPLQYTVSSSNSKPPFLIVYSP